MEDDQPTTIKKGAEPKYPIRYGIADMVCASILVGLHMAIAHPVMEWADPAYTQRTSELRLLMFALATALGAAYLAFRLATMRNITALARRLLLLAAVDVGLLLLICGPKLLIAWLM